MAEVEKQQPYGGGGGGGVVAVNPNPQKGVTSKVIDWIEKLIVKYMYDSSIPHHYLSGNFAPVQQETPPTKDLHVIGHLPDCLNGEFVRVGPNPKFVPVAGYLWFDGDGMVHGLRIKDGKATYVSRYVRTSRMKQEEYFGGAKFMQIGDLKGWFGLIMVAMQMLRMKMKVLDGTYGHGTANTSIIYHHGKVLALSEGDKPYVLKVLEDGDLQTIGLLDYDKRLQHNFTGHPKVDPITGEMFTFGYSHKPPYVTYRVISKDGFMHDPVPITVADPIMMHDFAITENYAIFMDLPMIFQPKEMVKKNTLIFSFNETKKSRFGVLPRYAKNEATIKWFELPNCFIFHNANAWEEGDEIVLITCRLDKPDLDMVNGAVKEKLENFTNELYEMRFNLKTGKASQKKLSAPAVDFPRVNESYTGRKSYINVIDAKTMSPDPVAVVEMPSRVPYGFHAFFVTEPHLCACFSFYGAIQVGYQSFPFLSNVYQSNSMSPLITSSSDCPPAPARARSNGCGGGRLRRLKITSLW
ncbi:hypothetical protein ACFE04_002900 [Oxalis oulophora]